MKNPLRLMTSSALFILATACGGQSDDPKTSDNAADLSAAEDGDEDSAASQEPGSTSPGSPGGGVDPREPTGCVPEYDESTSQGDAPCNFVSGGKCFVEGADACACAGCAEDQCIILESYPAQARCQ